MKKILCLVLCMILLCISLTSCSENVYEESKKNWEEANNKWQPPVVEEITLDFYIVKGEGTTDVAINDVEDRINQYLETKGFKTTLVMHYVSADEYEQQMLAAADPSLEDSKRADIVLITDAEMYKTMYADGKLANLTDMLTAAYKYGTLKTQIANPLIQAVTVQEDRITEYDVNGSPRYQSFSATYCVPNNHVIGSYTYALVNREVAKALHFGTDKIEQMVSADAEQTQAFIAKLSENGYDPQQCFKVVEGTFVDYFKYLDEYYVNVAALPEVSEDEAFSGAFGVVRHNRDDRYKMDNTIVISEQAREAYTDYYSRCLDIIYEINTSEELRNILQYGVENINYSADVTVLDDGEKITYVEIIDDTDKKIYNMDPLYTGDIFKAYFCEAIEWDEFVALYGELQNKRENPADPKYEYFKDLIKNSDDTE